MLFDNSKSARLGTSAADKADRRGLATIIERWAFYGLLSVIFLASIPYGTIDPFFKALLTLLVGVIASIRLVHNLTTRTFRISEPVLLMPLIGILLFAGFQTIPIPFRGWQPISADVYETQIFILSIATIVIVLEALFYFTRSERRLRSLIGLVLITGAASALFGILRDLLLADSFAVYFPEGTQSYAQFYNRNHFALLIEMALGLTLGILLKGELSEKQKFGCWLLLALFIYVAISANSRGGLISVAALGLFATFVHVMTKRSPHHAAGPRDLEARVKLPAWRQALLAIALSCTVLGAFIVTAAFVGGDAVVSRIEKLPGEIQVGGERKLNRLAIWESTVEMVKERPLVGFGFGAYAVAFPGFDASGGEWYVQQAHNDYLEILANGGIVGMALFAIFAVIVVRRAVPNFRSKDTLTRSATFGSLVGMFGVLVHSVVDFGLHLMINAMIFMVLVVICTIRPTRHSFLRRKFADA